MTEKEVEEMAECGKGHGGFIDITDHPDLSPEGLKIKAPSAFPAPHHQEYVESLFGEISADNLKHYNDKLSEHFTRYYTTETGKQAAHWIYNKFLEIKGSRTDITVQLFSHSWLQPSVIARIEGTDPQTKDEVIIISSHEDSIHQGATGRSPGADDNASGTATVIETFRVLVASGFVSDRSIEFHTYSAEEVGLRGSQDIASKYQKQGKVVFAQMQLDMTFYASNPPQIGLVRDYVNVDLSNFLAKVIQDYAEIPYVDTKCGYGCSDHASWYKAGYASSFPFETRFDKSNPKIHTAQDTISILDVKQGVQFVRIACGFAVELGLTN